MNMLTVSQVAKAINVSESMVRKMITHEELVPVRIGSKILFPENYIAQKFNLTQPKQEVNADELANAIIEKLSGIELPGGVKLLFEKG